MANKDGNGLNHSSGECNSVGQGKVSQADIYCNSSSTKSPFSMHPIWLAICDAIEGPPAPWGWSGKCAGGLVAATLICLATPALGQTLELSELDGDNGFRINGETQGDGSGGSLSAIGDVNGDGIDDMIIGAIFADPNGYSSGASYVIFGTDQGFSNPFELSSINGTNGFRINGETQGDGSGGSLSAAGDVNGDGIDDVIIGAPLADPNGKESGSSYVVFGSDQGFSTPLELSSLDGTNGFKINGEAAEDYAGTSVSSAGDINGDGIDDVVIGAPGAYSSGPNSGSTYVVFGRDQGFSTPMELSSLDGTNGFKLNGESIYDYSGGSVSDAGDLNGDGIDDLLIGAYGGPSELRFGASYVLFGSDQGFTTPIELSSLDGSNGLKLDGEAAYDFSGSSLSGAGDVNGDGINDVIIGASGADPNGQRSGASYVVFGSGQSFTTPIELSSLDGNNGFKLNGEAEWDRSGRSVSDAGDVNGDGINDVIIGAFGAGPNGHYSGSSYLVFGSDQGFSRKLELSSLDGTSGLRINGETAGDQSGTVSSAGDINGDGIDDVLIGAHGADPNGVGSGASYVVFGSPAMAQMTTSPMLTALGDINGDNSQDIAALMHDAAAQSVTATVKDAEDGSTIQQIAFSGHLRPVGLEVMADMNANGAPELVVLGKGQGTVQAEVRDSLTGALLGTVNFDVVTPVDLEIVPDQDGNGIPELAVLSENPVRVEVRDALTGNLFNTVSYNQNIMPKDLLILPDLNGKGGPDIGVLGEDDKPNEADRVEIRDLLTGEWVHKLTYGQDMVHQAKLVDDLNNNGTPEVAVLRTSNDGKVNVLIKDAQTRAFVQGIGYDRNYTPEELLIVPDVNGNTASEIAVFGKNPNNGAQKAQIKDGETRARICNVHFDRTVIPDDVAVIPDINGNGASEIGLLGTRENGNLLRLIIKDSKTGAFVGTVIF